MERIVVIQPVGWPDILNVVLVAVLVVATIFYAKRTHDMVVEMRDSRHAQLMPKLKLGVRHIGPFNSDVKIMNVGPGAAVNIQLEFWFGQDIEDRRRWTSPLMTSGEDVQFFFPDGATNDRFVQDWKTISMKASYNDVFNQKHEIEESFDFANYWRQVKISNQLDREGDLPAIRTHLGEIVKHLEK